MKTPILLSVAKPVLVIGAPLKVTVVNMGVFVITSFLFHPVVGLGLIFSLQGLAFMVTRKSPYFDRIWMAYFKRPATKSILPTKGHRYAGR